MRGKCLFLGPRKIGPQLKSIGGNMMKLQCDVFLTSFPSGSGWQLNIQCVGATEIHGNVFTRSDFFASHLAPAEIFTRTRLGEGP